MSNCPFTSIQHQWMSCLIPIFHIFVIAIPQSQHDDPCYLIFMHITCHFHIFVAFLSWCTHDFFLLLLIQEMCIHLQVAFKCQLLDLPIEINDILFIGLILEYPLALDALVLFMCSLNILPPSPSKLLEVEPCFIASWPLSSTFKKNTLLAIAISDDQTLNQHPSKDYSYFRS